ncbi:tRNA dihydrouridine(20/20a) synthase DusA [Rhodobiaceae bacterium]|nr:tRNA dihydrouridine(20/20a) synthase DusA [Rhodobiaceae bacterium]
MSHKFCVAPMIDVTNRHCRFFFRKFSKYSRLYTEMIVADAVTHGDKDYLLGFDQIEHPVALQLAGSDPTLLTNAAVIGEQYGYDEINLNIGCPSKRVQAGNFGACLMAHPKLVAECVERIKEKVNIPVTIKCRIGIDDYNPDEMLPEFVETLIKSDVSTFIIHARKAMLEGLDPKQNREIPPLDYDIVRMIKRKWPDLNIILNGGLLTPYSAKNEISASKGIELDGVMIGRAVLENPYSIIDVDKIFYNDNKLMPSRFKIAEEMINYLEESVQKGVPINIITQNMLGLFHGCRGAKIWRSYLSHEAPRRRDDPKVLSEAINLVFEAQNEAA